MLMFLCVFMSEEFEEGEGDAEEEATHTSFLSEGKTVASLAVSFPSVQTYCFPPRRTFLAHSCFPSCSWSDLAGADRSAASRTPEIISPLLVSCCSMTHLALMLPVATLILYRSEWDCDRRSAQAGRDEWESNDPQSFSSRPRWANNTVCVHHDGWWEYSWF